jgi:protein arginine kinase activator
MKCDLCGKNEAHVHVTQTFGDTSRKVDLCEACAEANGVTDPTGFSLVTLMEAVKKQKKPSSD